jgi:hypothetical protein
MSLQEKKVYRVDIPAQLDIEMVIKLLHLGRNTQRLETITRELADTARKLAQPRAVYQISHARVIDGHRVDIDGVVFTSRILSRLLRDQDTVIPFIATIGKELDEMPVPPRDMMRQFCADAIKTVVLVTAVDYLTEYLKEKHDMPRAALMNPGELADWPITEQKQLFALFGGAERQIGVTLTAGGAMKPVKSRSGLLFPNDTGFLACRLCTQFQCPGRKAKYDPRVVQELMG